MGAGHCVEIINLIVCMAAHSSVHLHTPRHVHSNEVNFGLMKHAGGWLALAYIDYCVTVQQYHS
jgi:hypothetical protein